MSPPSANIPSSIQEQTDHWYRRAAASLLGQLPCRAGCSRCCIGPFPITLLDVVSLQEGLERAPAEVREDIVRRATEQTAAMEGIYPALTQSPILDQWTDADIEQFVTRFQTAPCPALGEGGLCRLYTHRPLACRSMGIPEEERGIVNGACEVQTFVPIVRLSDSFRMEEQNLAHREALLLDRRRQETGAEGEEVLLPYGFLSGSPPARTGNDHVDST